MDRGDLLLYLIERFDYTSYLEIGCYQNETYDRIPLSDKTGVDPVQGGNIRMTSNEFFALNTRRFNVIFLDGSHEPGQVALDFVNARDCLTPDGAIVLHDALPANEAQQEQGDAQGLWTGQVWKIVAHLRCWSQLDVATGDFNNGCAVALLRDNPSLQAPGWTWRTLTWKDYAERRQQLLNVLDWEGMKRWIG